MNYVRESDEAILSLYAIRDLLPNMSIPEGADLRDIGFFKLIPTDAPAFNSATQELKDGDPVRSGDVYQQAWAVVAISESKKLERLEFLRAALVRRIDADSDAIYAGALGNRATEYAQAEADATAYKAAGYTGNVPLYVQAWATAKAKSAMWAADDILVTALNWRTAMAAIRMNRLGCKEAARVATAGTIQGVEDNWDAFLTAIKQALGL